MIVGVGVDMVEVERIRRLLDNPKIGGRFRDRVYTGKEIRYCENKGRGKYESYAGRFAAKEAVMKVLGKGWGADVGWLDIEVLPAPGGKPQVSLSEKTGAYAQGIGVQRLSLSITHTKDYAMAYAIGQND